MNYDSCPCPVFLTRTFINVAVICICWKAGFNIFDLLLFCRGLEYEKKMTSKQKNPHLSNRQEALSDWVVYCYGTMIWLCLCSHNGTTITSKHGHKYMQNNTHNFSETIVGEGMTSHTPRHTHIHIHTVCAMLARASLWDKYRNGIFIIFHCLVYPLTIPSSNYTRIVLKFSLTTFVFLLFKFTFLISLC